MRPVAPRLIGVDEVTIAEEQPEYFALVGGMIRYQDGSVAVLTRWRLSDEERARLAAGEDLYIEHLTMGGPFQPLTPIAGLPDWATPEPGDDRARTR